MYYLLKVVHRTVCFVRDGCLITIDHWILIGCNTFLWATRASSRDVTAINCSSKYFCLHASGLLMKIHLRIVTEHAYINLKLLMIHTISYVLWLVSKHIVLYNANQMSYCINAYNQIIKCGSLCVYVKQSCLL